MIVTTLFRRPVSALVAGAVALAAGLGFGAVDAKAAPYVGPGEKLFIDVTVANQMVGLVCTVVGDLS